MTCGGLGIDRFRVTLDGDSAVSREIPCTLQPQAFSTDLAAGAHTWSVEALDRDGEPLTAPIVGESFDVFPKEYRLVEIAVDFSLDTFLADPAFTGPQRLAIEYASSVVDGGTRLCSEAGSDLVISTAELSFRQLPEKVSRVQKVQAHAPAIHGEIHPLEAALKEKAQRVDALLLGDHDLAPSEAPVAHLAGQM